ncbi:MAG: dihydroorotate dehydrogenase-like protein [Nitriliruptorales bacterium]|nr:dihydroorotate dehydrogenase-like protein [Nitriliruptorales bacterium]
MTDLTTTYLGIQLRTPLVASASPMTGELGSLVALEAAGVGAAVLPSLFEEQIVHESIELDRMLEHGAANNPEAAGGYVPELEDYNTGPTSYLRHLEQAAERLEIPVIASLNGTTRGGWLGYARMMEDAGAAAIELNVYRVAADVTTTGREIEQDLVDLVAAVRDTVTVPVAVKLGPQYSAIGELAGRLAEAGADGLVLFNRFYQPDISLETLSVTPDLVLSDSHELRLPLRWMAILHGRVKCSLAATTGIHTWRDVLKVLLAGADVAMMTSAFLKHGPDHAEEVLRDLELWMFEREYESVTQLRGSVSQANTADPEAFERANYLHTLTSYASTFRM